MTRRILPEQAVVEQKSVFAQAFGVECLFGADAVPRRECIIEENEAVGHEVKGQIVERRHNGAENHDENGREHRARGHRAQKKTLQQHRHQNRKTTEHREHWKR